MDDTKKCKGCDEIKPFAEYSVARGNRDGLRSKCKVCSRAADKVWRETTGWDIAGNKKRWESENKDMVLARANKRYAAKKQRTPSWADRTAIDFAYHAAKEIHNVYGGTRPQVDHIYPLQGESVSGLHVASNLRLISAKDNQAKGNRL